MSCDCGAKRSLKDLYAGPGTLGQCNGRRPWLRGNAEEGCGEYLVPMTRGAINNYYSQILSLIALPEDPDDLERVISRYPNLKKIKRMEHVEVALEVGEEDVRQALSGYTNEEIWRAIESAREADDETPAGSSVQNPKEAEFELFTSAPRIGSDGLNSRLTGWRVPDGDWEGLDTTEAGFIREIVAISRLCVVTALYGFTRLEPASSPFDENFEEIDLQVRGQPLDKKITWLPAMEQFGEGFFLQVDPDWFTRKVDETGARIHFEKVEQRYLAWSQKQPDSRSPYPGHAYVFAHSLSHMLMEQISLDAGYPSTSLSERIYALSSPGAARTSKIGVLIYAAGSGSQGTLGGLLQQATRIPELVRRGLERIEVCGNDPICSTSPTPVANDDFSGFGASCHGCLFTAETSCEKRNMLLDRLSLYTLLRNAKPSGL